MISSGISYRKIGELSDLEEKGAGIVFDIDSENFISGFAVLYHDVVYCYQNKCPHAGSALDWTRGHFFDHSGAWLVCATHGALFDPATGKCSGGPCIGQSLHPIPVIVENGQIYARF